MLLAVVIQAALLAVKLAARLEPKAVLAAVAVLGQRLKRLAVAVVQAHPVWAAEQTFPVLVAVELMDSVLAVEFCHKTK
jgi:hypothetical protein